MNRSTIPTLLALFILAITVFGLVFVIKGIQSFQSQASSNLAPQDVRVTNIKDTSFTVSWITDANTIGMVRYSNGSSSLQTQATSFAKTHSVSIQNVTPNTSYNLEINSGGQIFKGGSIPSQVTTLISYLPDEKVISGQVLDGKGFPDENALVYIAINGVVTNSAVTSASGSWVISLPVMADSTVFQVIVENGTGSANALVDLKSANPMPTMTIGQTYDFRNQQVKQTNEIPQVPIKL